MEFPNIALVSASKVNISHKCGCKKGDLDDNKLKFLACFLTRLYTSFNDFVFAKGLAHAIANSCNPSKAFSIAFFTLIKPRNKKNKFGLFYIMGSQKKLDFPLCSL